MAGNSHIRVASLHPELDSIKMTLASHMPTGVEYIASVVGKVPIGMTFLHQEFHNIEMTLLACFMECGISGAVFGMDASLCVESSPLPPHDLLPPPGN